MNEQIEKSEKLPACGEFAKAVFRPKAFLSQLEIEAYGTNHKESYDD